MHPILFKVPGVDFPIRSFGLMLALGFLLGSWILTKLVMRFSDKPKEDAARYAALPVWLLCGIVIGARLLYVVVEITKGSETGKSYIDNPLLIVAVWQGGLVMYGGMFGAIVAGAWCCAKHKIPFKHALDLGLTAGFFGQAVGRVGCLLVGDDYGSVVPEKWQHLPYSLLQLHVPDPLPQSDAYPGASLFGAENAGRVLWATQPMMSIKALIVAMIALWLLPRRRYEGQVALVALLTYSTLRFGIEFLRGDEVRGVWFGGAISTSQLIAIASAGVSAALLIKNRARRDAPLRAS